MKWTIQMTQEELNRKKVIEQAIDKRIFQREGAGKLRISKRHFRRLLKSYRQAGDPGLVSGHRGKTGNRKLGEEQRQAIVKFMETSFLMDLVRTLLKEKLEEYKGIVICKETMRQLMIEDGKHHPKIKKKGKVHLERERRYRRGELVQIDGSYHAWLEGRGPKGCLLLFVDDATSAVLAAEFADHESFFAHAGLSRPDR